MSPLSIRDQSCPNETCELYEQEFRGNVWIHSVKDRRFKCKACESTWVEYRDRPTYRLRVDAGRFSTACGLLRSGLTVRQTAGIIGVSPSTVQRWKGRIVESVLS